MLNVLEKHKLIGGKGVTNTLTYLENNTSDFEIGELDNVYPNDLGVLELLNVEKLDDKCELYIDGTYPCVDKSPNPKNLTTNTSAYIDDKEGNTLRFTSNNYIKLGTNIAIGEEEDFTIEFKIKRISSDVTSNRWIIADTTGGSGNGTDIRCCLINKEKSHSVNIKSFSAIIPDIGQYITEGNWYTYTIERYKSIIYIRLNGAILYKSTTQFKDAFNFSTSTYFMNWKDSQNTHFSNCYLKELLITRKSLYKGINISNNDKGYRISPKIHKPNKFKKARITWEGEGTISISEDLSKINENTIFYLDGNDIVDKSPKPVALTNSGVTVEENGKFDKCIDFTGGKLTFTLDGSFVNKDFTIDWWEYDYSNGSLTKGVSSIFNNTTASSNGSSFGITINDNVTPSLRNGLCIASSSSSAWSVSDWVYGNTIYNEWVHRCIVRKNNTIYTYENGKLYGSLENVPTTIPINNTFQMGRWRTNTISPGKKISEFRVSNVALWTDEFKPQSYSYIYYKDTKIDKNETIKELPYKFQLKEEVKKGQTISNVRLNIQYGTLNNYKYPVDTDNEEDNRLYLYQEGNECVETTGGWVSKNFFNHSGGNYAIKQSDCLDYGDNSSSSYGYGGFYTKNKIDLSQYSKMVIDWQQYYCSVNQFGSGSGGASNTLALAESSSSNYNSSTGAHGMQGLASIDSKLNNYNNKRLITEVDLTNINLERHICVIGMSGYIDTDMSKCKTFAIWLEK